MATTPNLGLQTCDSASGSNIKFLDFRIAIAGTSSNMSVIDNAYGVMLNAIGAIRSNSSYSINGAFVSTNYYTATVSSLTTYSTGMIINLKLDITNTGSTTININSIGVKTLKKVNASGTLENLSNGVLVANRYYTFIYDGTYFVLINSVSDQVIVSGSPDNYVTISGSNTVIDSGIPILSGITAGSYNTVEVDLYGRITSGSVLLAGGHIIQFNSTVFPNRSKLTFTGGAINIVDDGGNDQTVLTVPSTQKTLTRPDTGAFGSWVNQGDTTLSDSNDGPGGIYLSTSGSVLGISGVYKAVPASPYEVICSISFLTMDNIGDVKMFFGWRDSATSALSGITMSSDAVIDIEKWTDESTVDTSYITPITNSRFANAGIVWIKLYYNDTTVRKISLSYDGRIWVDVHSIAYNDYITPTDIIMGLISNTTTIESKLILYSYLEQGV